MKGSTPAFSHSGRTYARDPPGLSYQARRDHFVVISVSYGSGYPGRFFSMIEYVVYVKKDQLLFVLLFFMVLNQKIYFKKEKRFYHKTKAVGRIFYPFTLSETFLLVYSQV